MQNDLGRREELQVNEGWHQKYREGARARRRERERRIERERDTERVKVSNDNYNTPIRVCPGLV